MAIDVNNLIFLGLNSRVAALNHLSGESIWDWRAPKPRSGGYVSLLLLNERQLIASVNGYTYCLDPLTGAQIWYNELRGFGTGVTSIVAPGKNDLQALLLAAAARAAQQSQAASAPNI